MAEHPPTALPCPGAPAVHGDGGALGGQSRAGRRQPALPLARLEPAFSTVGSSAARLHAPQYQEPHSLKMGVCVKN